MFKERKGLNIDQFNPGDIITRLQSSTKEYDIESEGLVKTITQEDGSYRGEPFKFLGIFNNMIVCECMFNCYTDNKIIQFDPYKGWNEGWGLYEDFNKVLIKIEKKQFN